ncbi:unnamed protein product [Symbiodinium sp. CCMP2592]|nr:unnamed protein product [Symbiodinium sp. CCMP2592]
MEHPEMRKLTSCVGYAKRMAARMQLNAVKEQLNIVLVALAGSTNAKTDASGCAGGRCNVSNQSVQTEVNVITEKEYSVLMNAVVARAEQCQEQSQSLLRRQNAVIEQLHSETRSLRLQSEMRELPASAATKIADASDQPRLWPGVASSSTPSTLEETDPSRDFQSEKTLIEQHGIDRMAQKRQRREDRHRLRARSAQELHIPGADESQHDVMEFD